MGFLDRLKRPDREKEAWTLWPGDSYLIEVTSSEVLELAKSTESPSKFVSIHSRENIVEIRFEGQELGLFNSEDSKYYISVIKLLEKSNLLPRTEFSVDKKGRVSISLERANSVLPFNQEIPGVTKFLIFESVACKDENKFSAGVKHLSREGWVDPGWFLLRRTNDGIQVLSYREPKNVFQVANIPKKNEKEIQSWPFDSDGFLLVPGYIDGKYSNSTNLFASDDYSTPQITLTRYVDIH